MIPRIRPSYALPSLLVLTLLVVAGCSDSYNDGDGNGDGNGYNTVTVTLRHDGENLTSPSLVGDTYEAAARFTAADTNGLEDGELVKVRFFIDTLPASCLVRVYGEGAGDEPGALLYSANVTSSLVAEDWNSHTLADPVAIPNGDLWIAVQFTHAGLQQTIGCDAGPAASDGRWLWDMTASTWAPFDADINWNIRGIVEVPE